MQSKFWAPHLWAPQNQRLESAGGDFLNQVLLQVGLAGPGVTNEMPLQGAEQDSVVADEGFCKEEAGGQWDVPALPLWIFLGLSTKA